MIKINDDLERSFCEKQAISERWGIRTLKRQMDSALFLRLAVSCDKEGILSLAKEGDLEQRIIDNLEKFLLNNIHYRVDLVFYHRILKCFVLIDLKKNSVQHEDIGQMNMYLGYFAIEKNMPDDNPSIEIILSKNKDELLIKYATYGMDSNLFVSKYELYLPNRKELERLVDNILKEKI